MTKKFICVQGSPEIPAHTEARENSDLYDLYTPRGRLHDAKGIPYSLSLWQIEGNECWEEVKEEKKAWRWVPELADQYYCIDEDGEIFPTYWDDGIFDNSRHKIGNVFRTEEEAQDELKRRESIANAWHPEDGEECYIWVPYESSCETYDNRLAADAYIGACHKTKEACEAWGKEYAHLFTKKSHN